MSDDAERRTDVPPDEREADTARGDASTPLFEELAATVSSTRDYLSAATDLAATEVRLAGASLAMMLAAALGVMVFVTSFWLSAATAVGLLLASAEMRWVLVPAGIAMVSLAVGGVSILYIVKTSRHLSFPLTRQLIKRLPDSETSRNDVDSAKVDDDSSHKGRQAA